MKLFGTLRITTNQLLLVEGNIPDRLRRLPTFDIRFLFDGTGDFSEKIPARFLSLDATSVPPIFDADRDTITVTGELSEKTAFNDQTREEISVPLLRVTSFIRHEDIASRAFQISKSRESASPQENWLRAENELLASK